MPRVAASKPRWAQPGRLTPVIVLNDEDLLLGTPKMGAVPQRILKTPITSLTGEQAQRSAALDFFF
ncbi:MAG: hypothetical protein EBT36_13075 [Betaproteobacteria bacterium]|nr:CcdB family protein [Pseudomonadota bacterium]NBP36406.1 hypothetical protein [Betaproteobacteria bacterium]NBP40202.1 hypothetical protein [Betaproteobacteria bacterium]NBQ79835.1 hypothetical protein [Betaproteobacteria bacterium]NBS40489.1 hypothetical protein [Betaproteobacteria bacterium]